MPSYEELKECLAQFRDRCNTDQQLRRMLSDWDRTILVRATDLPSECLLVVKDGEVFLEDGGTGKADLTVMADSQLLADLFSGRITPTEPYLNGSLRVLGTEEDVMRLDFISLMIWGE